MKPKYLKAIENIDADRKRWMKTELMVDLQITGEMAETLIDEYFGKGEPAPTFWIARSRLERVLSGDIGWPHVYTTDQSKHFECVPLFISAPTPAPAAQTEGGEDGLGGDRLTQFLYRILRDHPEIDVQSHIEQTKHEYATYSMPAVAMRARSYSNSLLGLDPETRVPSDTTVIFHGTTSAETARRRRISYLQTETGYVADLASATDDSGGSDA